jgi:signal transduction histidine kinase
LSQRSRVLSIIFLANLPLLLLALIFVIRAVADGEARIAKERVSLVRAVALTTDAYVETNLSTLQSLALTRAITDPTGPTSHPDLPGLLARIDQTNRRFTGPWLYGSDGWNIATPGAAPRTLYLGDREYFRRVLETDQPAVSSALIGRVTGNPAVFLAVPVVFTTGDRGVLIASLEFEQLGAQFRALLADQSIQIALIDTTGRIFVHPDPNVVRESLSGARRPEDDVGVVLGGEVGVRRVTRASGFEMLEAYAPVASTGWGVRVLQPTAEAFGLVRRQMIEALGFLALAAALVGSLSWYLGGRLSRSYELEMAARAAAESTARELRRATAESDARRRFLEEFIETAPVAIAILKGPEHRFVTVNSRLQQMKPSISIDGQSIGEVFSELAEPGFANVLNHVYATGEQVNLTDHPFQIEIEPGQCEERHFTVVISRYDGLDRQPEGLLLVALETTNEVLARDRANREKDEFLQIASHELKTPLTSLALSGQWITRMLRRDDVDMERLHRQISSMLTQISRATSLINDLLDVTRIQAGQLQLRREPIDLLSLTRAAVQRQQDVLPEGIAIDITLDVDDGQPLQIEGDLTRMEQVLTNLLSNAVKYSPGGGVVEVRLRSDDDQAILRVVDHGIGIPDHEHDRLFAAFSRTSVAQQSGIEGTGLGLYITQRIVRSHGGDITFDETPGGGTTFVVRLPLLATSPMPRSVREPV